MSTSKKSQRTFMTVTMITVIAITTVFIVYAAILGTYPGGNVSIQGIGGEIYYQQQGVSSWTATLNIANGTSWYSRLNLTTNVPSQTVNITWALEWLNGSNWDAVSTTAPETQIALAGAATAIYVTATGIQSGNYDWGAYTTNVDRTYRVKATVETP
jgi:hypothetical protein